MLFTAILILQLVAVYGLLGAKGSPQNEIFVESPDEFDASQAYRFNISVWFDGSINDFFAYQIYLEVNDETVKIVKVWLPIWSQDWVFYGDATVRPTPAYYDNDKDEKNEAVKVGDSLLASPKAVSGVRLLAIIELEVVANGVSELKIDNEDTYILNAYLEEIQVGKNNAEVRVMNYVLREPTEITLEVVPSPAYVGQDVIFTGKIIPDKPLVQVIIKTYILSAGIWVFHEELTVQTNETSQYSTTYRFYEKGSWKVEASWNGDSTHSGNSTFVLLEVLVPYTKIRPIFAEKVEIITVSTGANQTVPRGVIIGEEEENLPTRSYLLNITVFNVSDLARWRVKIYYNPHYVKLNASLPPDHILNVTGLSWLVIGPLFGRENGEAFMQYEVKLSSSETGVSVKGNATLFQINMTGIYMGDTEIKFSNVETRIYDSHNNSIPFMFENPYNPDNPTILPVTIRGKLPTTMKIVNPETGGTEFTFYTTEVEVGYKFNVSIVIEDATDLYGWRVKLEYNSSLLKVSRIIPPKNDPEYIFRDRTSSSPNWTIRNGELIACDVIDVMEESFVGDGRLLVVEFEIVMTPPSPESINKTESKLECSLKINFAETLETAFFDGLEWRPLNCIDGKYKFIYGAPSDTGGGITIKIVSIIEALPYIVAIIAVLIAIYVILKRIQRKKEEVFIEE